MLYENKSTINSEISWYLQYISRIMHMDFTLLRFGTDQFRDLAMAWHISLHVVERDNHTSCWQM